MLCCSQSSSVKPVIPTPEKKGPIFLNFLKLSHAREFHQDLLQNNVANAKGIVNIEFNDVSH
jgi:hypothetical protein